MKTIDGYLSRRAQVVWPDAIVYRQEDGSFTLERRGAEPVGLGKDFREAKHAIEALRRQKEAQHGT